MHWPVCAALVAICHASTNIVFHVSPLPHSLITSALGLLLVFRTNAAYERFWEARKVWGSINNVCRNLARTGYCTLDKRFHVRFARLVIAFPMALKAHLFCVELGKELDLLLGNNEAHEVRQDPNPPAAICNKLTNLIVTAINAGHTQSISSGLSRLQTVGFMLDSQYNYLQNLIGELINCLGMCERILLTPIPASYSRHTSRLLSIYCLTLPFVLVGQLDFFVVPATALICWGLFSIEEFGHFIEQPFSHITNVLPLDRFTKNVMADVERIMKIRTSQIAHEEEEEVMMRALEGEGSGLSQEEERLKASRLFDELREIENAKITRALALSEEL